MLSVINRGSVTGSDTDGIPFKIVNGYIKDAYEGMPAVVKLQEGVRGLPIVHEKTIPEIGWESKKSTEYDCCFTSFSYLCREKQKDL